MLCFKAFGRPYESACFVRNGGLRVFYVLCLLPLLLLRLRLRLRLRIRLRLLLRVLLLLAGFLYGFFSVRSNATNSSTLFKA